MIEHLWGTPISRGGIPDEVLIPLTNKILTSYDMNCPPSDFGLVNVLDDPSTEMQDFKNQVVYPAFDEILKETLNRTISDWGHHRFKGWMSGSSFGYNMIYHNHRGSQLTAVFYILCDDEVGGEINFTDPRQNANRGYDDSFLPWFKDLRFSPKSGEFIVFPSFLYHFVETYRGNVRLAIPVDLFLSTNK